MKKNILVISYSQSGQLRDVLKQFVAPLIETDHQVDFLELNPANPFPFPWNFWQFLDAFPETVALTPSPLAPLPTSLANNYDLIVLGWQPWFLSPAQPITAFLQSQAAKHLLAGKPIISVTACRNMWLEAFKTIKQQLLELNASLIDHVVLSDKGGFKTFITTPYWLLTGKKQGPWAWPPAGVSADDIHHAQRFGEALKLALDNDLEKTGQSLLWGLGAVEVDGRLIASERIGLRSFRIWSRLVRLFGPPAAPSRKPILGIYVIFLIGMILTVVPITTLIRGLLHKVLSAKLNQQIMELSKPSGSGVERIAKTRTY